MPDSNLILTIAWISRPQRALTDRPSKYVKSKPALPVPALGRTGMRTEFREQKPTAHKSSPVLNVKMFP